MCVQLVLFLGVTTFGAFLAFADGYATEPQVLASEGVVSVQLSGRLQSVWDTDAEGKPRLLFATVEAGGTKIAIDPNGCPLITSELLKFHNELGGALISGIRAEVEGKMEFKPYSEIKEGKNKSGIPRKLPPDTIVPVVRVETLKIQVFPIGRRSRGVNRDRDMVTSTTVGITKR